MRYPPISERPARLHEVAPFVVEASEVLTDFEKRVWYHTWLLDTSPVDACYISAKSFAKRLGRTESGVEDARSRLRRIDLIAAFKRPQAVQPGWVALLYAAVVPRSRTFAAAAREIEDLELARKFDDRVRAYDKGIVRPLSEHHSGEDRGTPPRTTGGQFRRLSEIIPGMDRSVSTRGEPTEGRSTSASSGETPFLPAVTDTSKAGRAGADAPEQQVEDPEPSPAQRRAMAQADAADREQVERTAAEELRRKLDERRANLARQRPERRQA